MPLPDTTARLPAQITEIREPGRLWLIPARIKPQLPRRAIPAPKIPGALVYRFSLLSLSSVLLYHKRRGLVDTPLRGCGIARVGPDGAAYGARHVEHFDLPATERGSNADGATHTSLRHYGHNP